MGENWQLRDLNPGCLAVATITTEPGSHHSNQSSQFSSHTRLVIRLDVKMKTFNRISKSIQNILSIYAYYVCTDTGID